jgi:multidrug efflux pump subunit AcrB
LQSGGLRVITEGLKPDDRVVSGRLAGLRPGMTVRPQEADMPAEKPPPLPDPSPSVRGQPSSGIRVEATYAGANAQTVSDSVRFPIEYQVSSLEKIRYMRSRCTSDGKYALDVTFASGVDPWRSQMEVQNRVALAMPHLPKEVGDAGVNVRRGTAGVLLIVTLSAPDGRFDTLYLGNYANIYIKDELARVAGVGEVDVLGASDYGLRIWLDTDRLAARNLNAGDVTRVLRKEKLSGVMDPIGLRDLIVKTDGSGRAVRLRDVARVEFADSGTSQAFQDGKPVVALVVHLTGEAAPPKVHAALGKRLDELRSRLPDGVDLDVGFDFTANLEAREKTAGADCVLLDLDLPLHSAERIRDVLQRGENLLRQVPGVQRVLAQSENPFDLYGGRPCLLVLLSAGERRKSDRAEVIRAIRARLGELNEATVRLRDFSAPGCFPRCAYPIDLALHGPDADEVRAWAGKLADRLKLDKKLTDVWVSTDSLPRPRQFVDVNREIAAARGVALADVFSTIEVYTGALPVNNLSRFGRLFRVEVQLDAHTADWAKGLARLKVRNAKGQMVALGSFVTVREVELPLALDFLDLRPMVELTGNAGPGVGVEAARTRCAILANEASKELGLTPDYRLTWMQPSPILK